MVVLTRNRRNTTNLELRLRACDWYHRRWGGGVSTRFLTTGLLDNNRVNGFVLGGRSGKLATSHDSLKIVDKARRNGFRRKFDELGLVFYQLNVVIERNSPSGL